MSINYFSTVNHLTMLQTSPISHGLMLRRYSIFFKHSPVCRLLYVPCWHLKSDCCLSVKYSSNTTVCSFPDCTGGSWTPNAHQGDQTANHWQGIGSVQVQYNIINSIDIQSILKKGQMHQLHPFKKTYFKLSKTFLIDQHHDISSNHSSTAHNHIYILFLDSAKSSLEAVMYREVRLMRHFNGCDRSKAHSISIFFAVFQWTPHQGHYKLSSSLYFRYLCCTLLKWIFQY